MAKPLTLRDKTFNIAILISTINFYLFVCCCFLSFVSLLFFFFFLFLSFSLRLLSMTLTGAVIHKVITKQNLLISFSSTLFCWMRLNLMGWWRNPSCTSWDYFWANFIGSREIPAVLLMHRHHHHHQQQHKQPHWRYLDIHEPYWDDHGYYWTLHFDNQLSDLEVTGMQERGKNFYASYFPD